MENKFEFNEIELVDKLKISYQILKKEISKKIIGQEEVIEKIFISMLSNGHSLLVGVPGLAKTLLIKTISDVMELQFSRIQFTPDLMPSDITGTEIIEEDSVSKKRTFKFIKGPVFANIILADEINRTPPKTQAALLEAMQEHKVTAAGVSYNLPNPFFVLATQNPIEQEGTYPLPEAQLDRFMFNLTLTYPSVEDEIEIIKKNTSDYKAELNVVIKKEELESFRELVRKVPVAENVIRYAVGIVNSTRPFISEDKFITKNIAWGAGPRASQYLIMAAKTSSILHGKYSPDIEDVRDNLLPVLRHRIVTNFSADSEGITSEDIIKHLTK